MLRIAPCVRDISPPLSLRPMLLSREWNARCSLAAARWVLELFLEWLSFDSCSVSTPTPHFEFEIRIWMCMLSAVALFPLHSCFVVVVVVIFFGSVENHHRWIARYVPIFPYMMHLKETAFRVVADGYVTADSGTGIVHQVSRGRDWTRVQKLKLGALSCIRFIFFFFFSFGRGTEQNRTEGAIDRSIDCLWGACI